MSKIGLQDILLGRVPADTALTEEEGLTLAREIYRWFSGGAEVSLEEAKNVAAFVPLLDRSAAIRLFGGAMGVLSADPSRIDPYMRLHDRWKESMCGRFGTGEGGEVTQADMDYVGGLEPILPDAAAFGVKAVPREELEGRPVLVGAN